MKEEPSSDQKVAWYVSVLILLVQVVITFALWRFGPHVSWW